MKWDWRIKNDAKVRFLNWNGFVRDSWFASSTERQDKNCRSFRVDFNRMLWSLHLGMVRMKLLFRFIGEELLAFKEVEMYEIARND